MVAARKTARGINSKFAMTTDQSCLNRLLTEVEWEEAELNERRLAWLQRDSSTRYGDRGVMAIDNVLIDHEGRLIQDVGRFWDHAEGRHEMAHDYLMANDVCTSGKDGPLEFRHFRKRERCEVTGEEFFGQTKLFCHMVRWVCRRGIPGDFTFDSYFTNAGPLNPIHGKEDRFGRPRRSIAIAGQRLGVPSSSITCPPTLPFAASAVAGRRLRFGDQPSAARSARPLRLSP